MSINYTKKKETRDRRQQAMRVHNACGSAAMLWPAVLVLVTAAVASTSNHTACNLTAPAEELCSKFCASECSFFNASLGETGEPQKVVVYRVTPRAITRMTNKDAGDPPGDLSFFLSRHDLRQECAQDPHAHGNGCFLAGDNVFVQYEILVDGRWGPVRRACGALLEGASPSI
jgi:hypothetical protein